MKQILLPFQLSQKNKFDNFISGDNNLIIHSLKNLDKDSFQFLWLWGQSKVGKTHLLQSTCSFYKESRVIYLPFKAFKEKGPKILDGLSSLDLLALDDIHLVISEPSWSIPLFNLYNELYENRVNLLVSSNISPTGIDYSLPDLESRATSSSVYFIKPLGDEFLKATLISQAKNRGMLLPDKSAAYLINYIRRDMVDIDNYLEKLDAASLIEKRSLTIPFIKRVLFNQ
tara:strand:+ start:10119 stop:10802 length:684 start_codon:yes stop_codon:yes gene_type:complete